MLIKSVLMSNIHVTCEVHVALDTLEYHAGTEVARFFKDLLINSPRGETTRIAGGSRFVVRVPRLNLYIAIHVILNYAHCYTDGGLIFMGELIYIYVIHCRSFQNSDNC